LLLLVDSLRQRGLKPLPVVDNLSATSVTLTFSQAALRTVFDDLYNAELKEEDSIDTEPENNPEHVQAIKGTKRKKKKASKPKKFLLPKAQFLEHHYPGNRDGWLKLWQNMILDALRTRDRNRLVYKERAEGKPSTEAANFWSGLTEFSRRFKEGELHEVKISGSLLVGAQQFNAERVSFTNRVDHAFLLHFWPLTTQVSVPQVIKRDEKGEFKREFGDKEYVIAIPEVSDLEEFCEVFPRVLANLDPELRGYRPVASLIDLPMEGGLEFLRYLTELAQQKAGRGNIKYSVSAIELFHLQKQDKIIKTWAAEKIVPRIGLMNQYEGVRSFCRNPFFKSQRLLNLLREVEWYEGFTRLFAIYPWEFFVHSEKTPPSFPLFSSDIGKQFEILNDEFQRQQEAYTMAESPEQKPQSLEKRIYDMVAAYVRYKAREKSGVKDDFKNAKYLEAKEKICGDIFLALRSRREQDFIEYFTGTICSVPQFLPADDYVFVSQTLLQDGG
jgi:CRISPR-associated protein Cmx8